MIVDSKVLMSAAPPSYSDATVPPPFPDPHGSAAGLATLPPHILLQVVYSTFPQTPSIDHGKTERQRKTLLWLVNSLRLVNRSLYIACMHVLRSTYLPAYQSLIRSPYTSDPFPTSTTGSPIDTPQHYTVQPIQSIQRETAILDRFIALKVREDVFVDDSEFHLEREDMFKDLFDHAQPKARLEDLVRKYGIREGVVSVTPQHQSSASTSASQQRNNGSASSTPPLSPLSPSTPTRSSTSRFFSNLFSSNNTKSSTPYPSPPPQQTRTKIKPIQFSTISISLAPRTISLVVGSGGNRKTLAQVQRDGRVMKLELGAKRLVAELKELLTSTAE